MKLDIPTALEQMVDQHGLYHVLVGLALMCGEKADHIRANYQDDALAHKWDRAANTIFSVAERPTIAKVSP
jgi:hypothetical protein